MVKQLGTSQSTQSATQDATEVLVQPVTTPTNGSVSRLPSLAIFGGAQEIEIEHNGAVYRLRQTALGKLILTK